MPLKFLNVPIEKISWTDLVKNEVLLRVKDKWSIKSVKRKKANWIRHVLHRNCLLKHVIDGKIYMTGRRGRRRKHVLDDL